MHLPWEFLKELGKKLSDGIYDLVFHHILEYKRSSRRVQMLCYNFENIISKLFTIIFSV